MKNLLMISFFHSSERHVGALRTQRFAHYLPRFGWKPYVLTKSPSNGRRDRPPKPSADTFYIRSVPLNKPFHLENLIWVPHMLKEAAQIARRIPVDAVLISCPPFYQTMAGLFLKKRFGLRLVIDYRDAWGLNPYRHRMNGLRRFVFGGDRFLERHLLRHTDLLVVSHRSMQEVHLRQFAFLNGRVEVIYNGFDPEKIGSHPKGLFREFTILHLGDFYGKQGTRDPSLFLSGLEKAVTERDISPERIQVLFIGERYREIEEAITQRRLSSYVSYLGRVPHETAMEYLNRSHALLLIENTDVMTTKVFEYLATGKPLLCQIKGGGELEQLVRNYSANAQLLSQDVDQVKEVFWACLETYEAGRYQVKVNEVFQNRFSRVEQTRRLAGLLDRVISREYGPLNWGINDEGPFN